jgi:rubrerythrin
MNRNVLISAALSVLLVFSFSSAANAQSKKFTKEEQKCIADLHEAMNGELTASVKYADYAKQADKEKLSSIAALFRATSRAEGIHLENHRKALADLGAPAYKPKVQKYTVKKTAANLKEVIAAEKYESSKMYPKFKYDAMVCSAEKAVNSFRYARSAEETHAKLYAQALAQISHPEKLASVYYLCPTCGGVYTSKPPKECEICGEPSSKFLVIK